MHRKECAEFLFIKFAVANDYLLNSTIQFHHISCFLVSVSYVKIFSSCSQLYVRDILIARLNGNDDLFLWILILNILQYSAPITL